MELFPSHITTRRPPQNLQESDTSLFQKDFSKQIPPFTIERLDNAAILADTICLQKGFRFYTKNTHLIKLGVIARLKRLALLFTAGDKEEKGIWIIDNWSHGYFHWLADAMPRLIGSKDQIDGHVVLLPSHFKNIPFVGQSLKKIGQSVLYYKTKRKLQVKELLLPSHTAPTGHYNKTIINKVREAFLDNTASANRRIYISRARAPKRKVINEDQIIPVLKSFNIEIHHFEDYDFNTQVKLMQSTTVLIGLHGAGLTNMLFMPAGAKILEFRNPTDSHHNCYFSLASDLSHDYYYLLSKSDTADTHTSDVSIDPEILSKILSEIFA